MQKKGINKMFTIMIWCLSIALLVYIFLSIIIKWKNLCKDENKIYVCADCNQAVIEPTFIFLFVK